MPRALNLISLLALITACPPGGGHHPQGFDRPSVHGLELKTGAQDCRECHGEDLTGDGDAVSCDSCHDVGWREDCTFCHGGDETLDGAPPAQLDPSQDPAFGSHTSHLDGGDHADIHCSSCHSEPSDVLTAGHVFDDTPGVAEVDFAGGLALGGSWDGATCTVYCHGNGQRDGEQLALGGTADCGDCHVVMASSHQRRAEMSGAHRKHLNEGVECWECHPTTAEGDEIQDAEHHVDGEVQIELQESGMTRQNGTCDGECHDENHHDRDWFHD